MIGVAEVHLSEYRSFMEGVKGSVDQGQWVCVLYRNVIQSTEIDARAEGAVFLPNEEEICPYWRRQGPNNSCIQGIADVRFHGVLFGPGEVLQAALMERGARDQLNGTVIWAMRGMTQGVFFAEDCGKVMVFGRN